MKRRIAVWFALIAFAAVLLVPFAPRTNAQEAAPAQTSASAGEKQVGASAPAEEKKAGEAEKKEDSDEDNSAFRHSAAVQAIAKMLNIDVETAAKTFEYLNFAIIALAIIIPIFKILPRTFRKRSEDIQKQLKDARTATEEAGERLNAVEARLSKLDDEIASMRQQVEQDSAADEVRIKASIEEEHKRIVEAASQEIESASLAARRELKQVAAELAIERAVSRLSLTPEVDRRLVADFAQELGKDGLN